MKTLDNVHFSQNTDEWATPQYVFDMLNDEFHFTLDAAASVENAKCEKFYTKENDGLKMPWGGEIVFCNPPYSQLRAWIQKARASLDFGATTVMLIPSRTDTAAFHNHIYKQPDTEIRFLRGRLKFGDAKAGAPFPSMVVIFRKS
jgi:phage N-6-adenine-methyltransferase